MFGRQVPGIPFKPIHKFSDRNVVWLLSRIFGDSVCIVDRNDCIDINYGRQGWER